MKNSVEKWEKMQIKSYTSLEIEVIIPKIQEKKVKLRGLRYKGKFFPKNKKQK